MPKYLVLFMTKEAPVDQSQREAMAQPWRDWMGGLQQQGKLEGGMPVGREGKVVKKRSFKDYKAKTKDVSGFLLLKAESMDEAIKITQTSPFAKANMGTIIVKEEVPM